MIGYLILAFAFSSYSVLAQISCNGHPSLCSQSYAQITFPGAHDSFAVKYGSPAANQNYLVDTQLKDGIRLLQGQGHLVNNAVELCHTDCGLLDAGSLTSYLKKVRSFLDSNPNEVITLIWSNQNVDISLWAKGYVAAGLDKLSFIPSTSTPDLSIWPTLSDMISSNQRVVSFIDKGAKPSIAPYLLDEFTYVFETPFDETNQKFPCNNDRPGGSPDGKLYVMNHFLDTNLLGNILIPNTPLLNETNSDNPSQLGSIAAQIATCQALYSRNPNFILVDFYDQPNAQAPLLPYTAQLNGFVYTPASGGIGNGTLFNGTTIYKSTSQAGSTSSGSGSGTGTGTSLQTLSKMTCCLALISVFVSLFL